MRPPAPRRKRWSDVDRRRLAAEQQWRCADCDKLLDFVFEVDHLISLGAGGEDTPENTRVICPLCHRKKTIFDVRAAAAVRRGEDTVFCGHCNASFPAADAHVCVRHRHRAADRAKPKPKPKSNLSYIQTTLTSVLLPKAPDPFQRFHYRASS